MYQNDGGDNVVEVKISKKVELTASIPYCKIPYTLFFRELGVFLRQHQWYVYNFSNFSLISSLQYDLDIESV